MVRIFFLWQNWIQIYEFFSFSQQPYGLNPSRHFHDIFIWKAKKNRFSISHHILLFIHVWCFFCGLAFHSFYSNIHGFFSSFFFSFFLFLLFSPLQPVDVNVIGMGKRKKGLVKEKKEKSTRGCWIWKKAKAEPRKRCSCDNKIELHPI